MFRRKIRKLSQEQKALLPVYRDKWIDIALSTEPLDLEASKAAIEEIYGGAGLQPPARYCHFKSPLSAVLDAPSVKGEFVGDQIRCDEVWRTIITSVKDKVWLVVDEIRAELVEQVGEVRSQVSDQMWEEVRPNNLLWTPFKEQIYASENAHLFGFYEYLIEVCDLSEIQEIRPFIELAKHCGRWAPYETAALLQDRPSKILFDDQKRLHCEDGPAIEYRDGFGVYSWHGTRIPKRWILDSLSVEEAQRVMNGKHRQVACEIAAR